MRIDLHAHSNASDGTDSPAELVGAAVVAGLDVVALTDHDTVAGHAEAADAVHALPDGTRLTVVPGAELSCVVDGISMHLLAYLFDPEEPEFARERELVRTDRFRRGRAVVERCRELGADISWEQVQRIAGAGSVGRPHIASALVEAGVVGTVSDAFTPDWLANGGRADVRKHETDPVAAVRLVRAAGGVPVFAHPGAVKRGRTVPDQVIADLAAAGLAALEVDHTDHDEETRRRLRGLAGDLGLLVTGSSDYHGGRKTVRLGEHTTDPEVYEALLAQATGAKPITR
ncbi:PHP domain-containing protein [Kitasatospora aureofaciens]|uniref:Phosphatase n=1 Tax=Kitasatospora aureofaciens TaxID=1894 RepID=A0A1E7N5Q2_KITAU|nr:PHP domain-containing protein [Kitasatospora aureofaciens]QEV00033.1 PHP domain-containing protein [Streptomyces viridifaciens]ARF78828.1 phosphatase [Kitasatospora aureofaciens]OEV36009.1 phosphatase [Kitasatospora aureofaciens]UKZ06211.1 PHP domain-containing protein [Streptomyces viridifaciens]GGU76994.1 phosphatase [Kitasatospora aureofaciens]